MLDRLKAAGVSVTGVGKIEDIFAHRGLTRSFHTNTTIASQQQVLELVRGRVDGLIFANFIDFDMLYGHRRDVQGYASALEQTDRFFNDLLAVLRSTDWLIVTADHGNDPTFHGTDHTREYVPLLAYQPGSPGYSPSYAKKPRDLSRREMTLASEGSAILEISRTLPQGASLGIRHGFYDVAQSLATIFGLPPMPRGVSFVERGNLTTDDGGRTTDEANAKSVS